MKIEKIFIILIVAMLLGCSEDDADEQIHPKAKLIEGTYTGTLRPDISNPPQVEITAKAGPGNTVILTFEHNIETGKVELIGRELEFVDFSYDDYLMFNIGNQTSGEKAQYDYSGRRIRYDALLPAREGYFLFKPDGKMELWLSAIVTTDDNREYQMVMNAQKN